MSGTGLIGPDSAIDDLLADYFGGRPESWLYQVFESEQAALTAAVLMELRNDGTQREDPDDAEARYYSSGIDPIDVESVEGDSISWDFSASTVVVKDFDAPIVIALKNTNKLDREIYLTPDDTPFSISGANGVNTSELWYRKPGQQYDNTSIRVVALK
ncbi:hypothetical protein [Halostella salina]|uniref:hypothetical protein n=1 Tax=Halostella salina TaxID=1547897 RepID=UPI000EF7C8AA|nr:hypothetical protein [Halostella salina]